MFLFSVCTARAQIADPFYQSLVNAFSYDSILKNLQSFETLGIKTPGSQPLIATKNWLISKGLPKRNAREEIIFFPFVWLVILMPENPRCSIS